MVERAIAEQPDMAALAPAASSADVVERARRLEPDVMIVGLTNGGALPGPCVQALTERPRMRLLGIDQQAVGAHLYELQPVRTELGELSISELIDAIRKATQRPSLLDAQAL
jgi:hypothetical protein